MEDSSRNDAGGGAMMEMPRYISCKRVWALKIAAIEQAPANQEAMHRGGDYYLRFEDSRYLPKCVGADWVAKRGAQPGGYYIVYEDGYTSWSPAEAFERGNTPEAEWGIPRSQETKYGINLRGKLFNRATGAEVTCPIWVLLAKDTRALPQLVAYRADVPPEDQATRAAMDVVILNFSDFRHLNPGLMKAGDSKGPMPPLPHSLNPLQEREDMSAPRTWAAGEREGT